MYEDLLPSLDARPLSAAARTSGERPGYFDGERVLAGPYGEPAPADNPQPLLHRQFVRGGGVELVGPDA